MSGVDGKIFDMLAQNTLDKNKFASVCASFICSFHNDYDYYVYLRLSAWLARGQIVFKL